MCGQHDVNIGTHDGIPACRHPELDYRNDCVRDLAWAVFSPPLVTYVDAATGRARAPAFALTPARRRRLAMLDADPAPLLAFLAQRQGRFLGVYFEALWRFFLSHDEEVTLLASNRQVIDAGRTVGEFDMFYHCHRRNAVVHLELAVKFYLGLPVMQDADLQHAGYWLGPNCIDRLDLKINHLRNHQLPLIAHERAVPWLQRQQLLPALQEVAMHGYLYFPWGGPAITPRPANPQHLRSYWLRDDELERLRADGAAAKYRVVPRLQWLCTHAARAHEWLSFDALRRQIAEEFRLPLMQPVLCETCGGDNLPRRVFIVPQDWPAMHWPRHKP
jgi:hypothetical protein